MLKGKKKTWTRGDKTNPDSDAAAVSQGTLCNWFSSFIEARVVLG